jgi:hypothetical protein
MAVEIIRAAHFDGGGADAPTDVMRAPLDDGQVYYLRARRGSDSDKIPTIALTVEKKDAFLGEVVQHVPGWQDMQTQGLRYPDATLRLEQGGEAAVPLKYALMLTYAALEAGRDEWGDIGIIPAKGNEDGDYAEELGVSPMRILYLKRVRAGLLLDTEGYYGDAEKTFGVAAHALRRANIFHARYMS